MLTLRYHMGLGEAISGRLAGFTEDGAALSFRMELRKPQKPKIENNRARYFSMVVAKASRESERSRLRRMPDSTRPNS